MTFPKRALSMAAPSPRSPPSLPAIIISSIYPGRSGPFNPIMLHFDLTQLTNNTVNYFISDQGPNVFVKGDSFTAVISELQLAAQAWNNVPSSQIKLAYGGTGERRHPAVGSGNRCVFLGRQYRAGNSGSNQGHDLRERFVY